MNNKKSSFVLNILKIAFIEFNITPEKFDEKSGTMYISIPKSQIIEPTHKEWTARDVAIRIKELLEENGIIDVKIKYKEF